MSGRSLTEQQVDQLRRRGVLVPIFHAWEKFGPPELVEKAQAAERDFHRLMNGQGPRAFLKPHGEFFTINFELLEEACDHARLPEEWDVDETGQNQRAAARHVLEEYTENRNSAHIRVMFCVSEGSLVAFGARLGQDFERIRVTDWCDLKLDLTKPNVASADGLTYRYVFVADPKAVTDRVRALTRSRGHAAQDLPLIEEMHQILTVSPPQVSSLWEATLRVVDRAAGGGTLEAKRKRLLKRYSEVFSSEQKRAD